MGVLSYDLFAIARPLGRSIVRSLDRSIARSLDRSVARLLGCSVARWLDRSVARSLGRHLRYVFGYQNEGGGEHIDVFRKTGNRCSQSTRFCKRVHPPPPPFPWVQKSIAGIWYKIVKFKRELLFGTWSVRKYLHEDKF